MPRIDVDAIADEWDDDGDLRPRRKKLSAKAQERIAEQATARVVAVDRGRVTVLYDGEEVEARYAGSMRGRKVVVGDEVRVKPPRHASDQARITDLLERRTVLARTADDAVEGERVVVANADRVVVVLTAEWLEGGIGFLDRVLVAASSGGLAPVVCVNKVDLAADPRVEAAIEALEATYGALGLPVVRTSAKAGTGLDDLRDLLRHNWTAFAGHSGVGKTSLFNRLVPGVDREVGELGRRGGRHTTVSSRAHHIPEVDAWLVDTPGVRSFGLAHLEAEKLVDHFPEFADLDDRTIQRLVNGEDPGLEHVHPRRMATYLRFREALLAGDIDRPDPDAPEESA